MTPCEETSKRGGTESLTFTISSTCWRREVNRGLAATAAIAVVVAAGVMFVYLYVVQDAAIFETDEGQPSPPSLSVTPGKEQELGGVEQLILSKPWAEGSGEFIVLRIQVKNTGTRPAIIDDVLINGRPSPEYGSGARAVLGDASLGQISIDPNGQVDLTIYISKGDVTSGQHLDVTVLTESGNEFPIHVVVP